MASTLAVQQSRVIPVGVDPPGSFGYARQPLEMLSAELTR
jgi:hypothetical protein